MNFDDGRKFSYPLEKFMKLIEIDYNMNNNCRGGSGPEKRTKRAPLTQTNPSSQKAKARLLNLPV